jgi:hypothetical protein
MDHCEVPIEMCLVIADILLDDFVRIAAAASKDKRALVNSYARYLRFARRTNQYLWSRVLASAPRHRAMFLPTTIVRMRLVNMALSPMAERAERFFGSLDCEAVSDAQFACLSIQSTIPIADASVTIRHRKGWMFDIWIHAFLGFVVSTGKLDVSEFMVVARDDRDMRYINQYLGRKYVILSASNRDFHREFRNAFHQGRALCFLDCDIPSEMVNPDSLPVVLVYI